MGFEAHPIQTNFTSGEVSPLIRGRVDLDRYFNGVEILENFYIRPQGGILRRSGSRFVAETKDSSETSILQEFEFSTIQAYVLEFGDLYFRIYRNGGVVEDPPGTPVEVVTPYTEAELPALSFTQSADILYVAHPNHRPRKISRTSNIAWTITILETTDGPYLPENLDVDNKITVSNVVDRATLTSTDPEFLAGDVGDDVEYTINGEFTIAEIITFIDVNNVTIAPRENVIGTLPKEVTITSISGPGQLETSNSIFNRGNVGSDIRVFGTGSDGWYPITAYDGTKSEQVTVGTIITEKVITGTLTRSNRVITADLTAIKDTFVSTDVNRHIRLNLNGQQIFIIIKTFTDTKNVGVELQRPVPLKEEDSTKFESNGVTDRFRLGAWSVATGQPSKVIIHEQRLMFANSSAEPQTVWMSKSADFENFAPTEEDSSVLDNSAITYTISSNKVNAIEWLASSPVLLIGTLGGEWQVKASTISLPITPTNIIVTQQTYHGSKENVKSKLAGNAVFFIQRSGRELRELQYNFEVDSYLARDMTIVSEHILRDGGSAVDIAYQQAPNSIMWVLRNDGQLAALTYVNEQRVFGWHRHILGGSFGTGDSVVESIATVPSIGGTEDSLYMIVKRTIGGATKRFIEFFEIDFHPTSPTDKDKMLFMDSALSFSGAPATIFSNIDHLEGELVDILADGSVIPPQTVSGGKITLENSASEVSVGLNYESLVRLLPLEAKSPMGTAQGKIKRIHQLTLRLLDSLGFLHGDDINALTEHSFRTSSGVMDDSPDLKTEDITINLEQGYETLADYNIKQEKPYPLTIIALMPEVRVYK